MSMKNPVHLCRIAKNAIEGTGLSIQEIARRLGVSRPALSRLINERASISPEKAVRVSKAFGLTAGHWVRLQMAYDLANVERKARIIKVKSFQEAEPFTF